MVNETGDSGALSLSYTMTPDDWIEFNVWHHDVEGFVAELERRTGITAAEGTSSRAHPNGA